MHQNILWKEVLGATFLILFAAVGVAHVINPDWFTKHSGIRKGGGMLTEWNRLQFQVVGGLFAGLAIYGLYLFLRD